MKANYPVEYMTALLSAELHGSAGSIRELKMFQAIEECKVLDIKVLPPDINKSLNDFSIEDGVIRFGLSAIKNVGSSAIESIISSRAQGPFTSLKDLLTRIDTRRVNKKTVESLIKAGALDAFGDRLAVLTYYPVVLEEVGRSKKDLQLGQFTLFASSMIVVYLTTLMCRLLQ